ncbi:spore germination protein [Microaerobacter geothermalis]|uniref:spore germination protein n=1 Tax=Microaerobacter geothermalis TaxID=674972 RepID=UPI001F3BF870|nr:spore germination protein [Microaerobacter geothermalis]MCF6093300.1 spore germination protein [Microaerobacter geothermalis]
MEKQTKAYRKLKDNEQYLKETLGGSADIVHRHFVIPGLNNRKAFLIYIDGLVNTQEIDDSILRPLVSYSQFSNEEELMVKVDPISSLMEAGVLTSSVKMMKEWEQILDSIVCGDTALFIEGSDKVIIHATRGWDARSISEPITEGEVRGPRDGFIESIRSNTALIRRRIRDYGLRFENMKIGKMTKTDVSLAYIDCLADKGILEELKKRLKRIDVDSILESGYLEEYIEDSPFSPFPQIEHTERPDKAAAAILEGRIVIIVDNTPFVLMVPTVMWQFLQASGDYYERYFMGSFLRWIRFTAFFLSLTLPSIYVLLVSFHQEMIPTPLALNTAAGRESVPFPAIIEALLMETMFEILREAGIRMPRQVGQAVSIVGALVIGDAAVKAGIISPTMVIIIAATGISSFAIPAYTVSFSLRLLRFPLLLLSGTLGVFGFIAGTIFIVMHLLSLRSFGAPYLAPISPLRMKDMKDVAVRVPWWTMLQRPQNTQGQNSKRQIEEEDLKPKPPSNKGRSWRKIRNRRNEA